MLTTLSYFDVPIDGYGNLDTEGPGYQTFISDSATNLFKKAHAKGTRVVLTLTAMNNPDIDALMDSPDAQNQLAESAVSLVEKRGIDGLNIDFEYTGDPGDDYRNKFSDFILYVTNLMHNRVPASKVTVSVYASSVKDPKIYDIGRIAKTSDGIFMMAYDFATASSKNVIPTSPLYGHKQGQYWYDVSSAVDDFLKVMDPNKLILGVPWYGYNYPVNSPSVKAATYQGYYYAYWYRGRRYYAWAGGGTTMPQTYADVKDSVHPASKGWDNLGKVGWVAYVENGIWRMIFMEDVKSLTLKYDFAKQKKLLGVGIWALGNDNGKSELWDLLVKEFGQKITDITILNKKISDII